MLACKQTDVMDFFSPPKSPLHGDVVHKAKGLGSSAWCGVLMENLCWALCSGSVPTKGWGVRQI